MDILFFDGHVVETMIQCYLKPERGHASPTMKHRFSLRSFYPRPRCKVYFFRGRVFVCVRFENVLIFAHFMCLLRRDVCVCVCVCVCVSVLSPSQWCDDEKGQRLR
ncbi:unnamed protein product [Arctogadus glacialis]